MTQASRWQLRGGTRWPIGNAFLSCVPNARRSMVRDEGGKNWAGWESGVGENEGGRRDRREREEYGGTGRGMEREKRGEKRKKAVSWF